MTVDAAAFCEAVQMVTTIRHARGDEDCQSVVAGDLTKRLQSGLMQAAELVVAQAELTRIMLDAYDRMMDTMTEALGRLGVDDMAFPSGLELLRAAARGAQETGESVG